MVLTIILKKQLINMVNKDKLILIIYYLYLQHINL